jgi:hypothetical protein
MKVVKALMFAIVAMAISLAPVSGHSDEVVISGVYVGMSRTEYNSLPLATWSVGRQRASRLEPTWEGGQLLFFTALFDARDFDHILAAVKNKFPETQCVDSKIQNGFGATLVQTTCHFKELTVKRVFNHLSWQVSALILGEPRPTREILDDI